MLLSYLKIAFRTFLRSKVPTTINIVGLTAGFTCVLLIFLYINHELSYDKFLPGAENVYRIVWINENPQTRTPHPMAQALVADFAEVESGVSISPLWSGGLNREVHSFRNPENDGRFDEAEILAVDTSFFRVFPFEVIRGDVYKALKNVQGGIIISESTARKYFGDNDPVGKQLAIDSDNFLVEVTAVVKDVPENSHFHFDFLVSYLREKSFDPEDSYYSWADFGHFNYVRLKPGADPLKLESQLMNWSKKYLGWSEADYARLARSGYGFKLQPISEIHLHSHLRWELEPNGNISYVYILGSAAAFILLIACFNFMNLATAKASERAKEIGVRKSMGAFRRQLSFQFMLESVLIAMIAVVLSLVVLEAVLPLFNNMAGTQITISFWYYTPWLMIAGIIIGVVAGLYPSLFLSSYKPSAILKGDYGNTQSGRGLRNTLIVLQFGISMALISGSIIIFNQLDLLQHHDVGYDRNGVLIIPLKSEQLSEKLEPLRTSLLTIPGVKEVSGCSNVPGTSFNQHSLVYPKYPDIRIDASECFVDPDFLNVMNIEVVQGRGFEKGRVADSIRTFMLNESAVHQLNLEQPVGAELTWLFDGREIKGRVIGVVKDFNYQSLHEPIRPLVLIVGRRHNYLIIKTTKEQLAQQLPEIEKVYRHFDPYFAFEYSFLDSRLEGQYASESRLGVVMSVFSTIAIVIASFGLFGIALFTFYRRAKEISIRKVLGAGVGHLVVILLGNFTRLVIIAILVATPITWWIMNGWLENFSFRVQISPFVFGAAALVLLGICWTTLAYLTIKTTSLNPAETLKSE